MPITAPISRKRLAREHKLVPGCNLSGVPAQYRRAAPDRDLRPIPWAVAVWVGSSLSATMCRTCARRGSALAAAKRSGGFVPEPTVATPSGLHLPIRTQVRGAVERAWTRAVASGSLPGAGRGRGAPGSRGGAAGRPVARRLRHQPRDEAGPPVPDGAARDRRGRSPSSSRARPPTIRRRRRSPRSRWRRPGSSTSAWPIRRSRATVAEVLAEPDGWGRVAPLGRRSVNVEFVSANPTGPLHIGNARGAFVGDLLCRVLEAGGQQVVTREYYFNDSGGQIRNLGRLGGGAPAGRPGPRRRLQGRLRRRPGRRPAGRGLGRRPRPGADTDGIVGHWAAGRVREGIERSLADLGVRFDVWTSEARLHDEGLGRPRGPAAS